ncbi:orotidine-5'-phosphate decarboxylase [Aeromicrobium sp. 636]|uniref:Orotidine 5'-phosphate decarboxylase n=1 Tax=Aeromicrobium senzhongii TaxID=2663859 RepID=A0A8I0JZF2_9ACTN|nr:MULTISPECIES: orotidine-5'-phosphate decarboxylase [Aeromicrobium]MBC9225231.1 orotidine-5'-phosphate decarboxylase [Aeromicrobium senzhongii]MCQ3997341.1 orotidine-5'-phosphate decarboxylase [Aeromicrobium sp. 636]MTB87277.1 orotidine-5'-phosphate decarboxylase [Aeromicrobium senzhongii]QNL95656.1 orotidine-5'-phosphate decarboxylase [Aeromicrobium senzhongii]
MSFGSRAQVAMQAYGPLCVGIDPHPHLLEEWGLEDSVEGLDRFAATCVEAFAGKVAFVKPQSAFFERFGARGVAILERTLQDLRHTGSLTILDVKRGDIGSTTEAYADAYLDDDAPMAADAITVSPYLGFGSLTPFFAAAEKNDAGVFVLAFTSNPEAIRLQTATTSSGMTVGDQTLAQLALANEGAEPMGSFGAVIGARVAHVDARRLDINGPILVPGFGAQGGTVEHLRELFGSVLDSIIPSTSREVLAKGPDVIALRAAAAAANDSLSLL